MKKLLKILFSFLILSFILAPQTKAADLDIDCPVSPTACSKSGLDPLFSNSLDGFWYPGKSITKTLNLKNSGLETREMAIKGTRTSAVNILENVMHISIVGGTTVIWSGSVADFYGQEKIGMGNFDPGADLNYDFTVFMSSGAGDEYQNKETIFDLTLGFWGEPISTPTPTPTSAPGGGGGGTVLGAGVSAPVCNDTKPGSAPSLLSAIAGTNSVTLTWSEAKDPVTYYLVAYGTSSGVVQYGNPNIGGKGTTSYTVQGLSGGKTYYFKVRAGNGCMPGDYSNELSAIPGGGFITGPATGFTEGILGVETEKGAEASPSPSPEGGVLGEEASTTGKFMKRNWVWIVVALVAVMGFVYLRKRSKKG